MKTRIIICVSNRPDLLEKQIELLNNFMIGEKVVSIVYDTGNKYITKHYSDDWIQKNGYNPELINKECDHG